LPGSIAIYDVAAGIEIGRFEFTDSFGGTPNFPLAIAALNDGSKLYVASQRDSAVYVSTPPTRRKPKLATILSTGSHPIALLLDKSQSRLFVANAQSDTISIVETRTDKIAGTVLLRPEAAKHVTGATPNGMSLSPDEKRLYVTLGDMNAVAVVDIADREVDGYIPAGWYPSAVVTSADGHHLFVANAKGSTARVPNPPATQGARHQSPLNVLEGNVMTIPFPPRRSCGAYQRVLELDRLTPRIMRRRKPAEGHRPASREITHVIYIVKENRSYDQVLGDLAKGNGDPSRTLFGRQSLPTSTRSPSGSSCSTTSTTAAK